MKKYIPLIILVASLFADTDEGVLYRVTTYKPEKQVYENVTQLSWNDYGPSGIESSKVIRFRNQEGKDVLIGKDWIAEETGLKNN